MNQLVVQLIEPSSLTQEWSATAWLFNHQLELLGMSQAMNIPSLNHWLNALKSKHQLSSDLSLIALAPALRGHVRILPLKKGQAKYINEVTPVLMEPYLAQPIEEVHFTNQLLGNDQILVCAVSKSTMSEWRSFLESITAVHKKLVLTQIMLVEALSNESTEKTVSFLNNVFQQDNGHIFALPACASQHEPRKNQTLDKDIKLLTQHLLPLKTPCNLLHGEFMIKSNTNSLIPFPKTMMALFCVTLSIACGWLYYQTSLYTEQTKSVEQKSTAAFLKLAPDEGRVVNLNRQIEGRIRQHPGQIEQKDIVYTPYTVLNLIDSARIKTQAENSLQLIAYRNGVYILEWRAKQQETLEALRVNLEKEKLNTYLDQVVKNNQEYVGSYRIQGLLK